MNEAMSEFESTGVIWCLAIIRMMAKDEEMDLFTILAVMSQRDGETLNAILPIEGACYEEAMEHLGKELMGPRSKIYCDYCFEKNRAQTVMTGKILELEA